MFCFVGAAGCINGWKTISVPLAPYILDILSATTVRNQNPTKFARNPTKTYQNLRLSQPFQAPNPSDRWGSIGARRGAGVCEGKSAGVDGKPDYNMSIPTLVISGAIMGYPRLSQWEISCIMLYLIGGMIITIFKKRIYNPGYIVVISRLIGVFGLNIPFMRLKDNTAAQDMLRIASMCIKLVSLKIAEPWSRFELCKYELSLSSDPWKGKMVPTVWWNTEQGWDARQFYILICVLHVGYSCISIHSRWSRLVAVGLIGYMSEQFSSTLRVARTPKLDIFPYKAKKCKKYIKIRLNCPEIRAK